MNRTVKSLTIGGQDLASATLELVGGTTLTATNGTSIFSGGVLGGYGALAGNLTSSGTVRIGGSGRRAHDGHVDCRAMQLSKPVASCRLISKAQRPGRNSTN